MKRHVEDVLPRVEGHVGWRAREPQPRVLQRPLRIIAGRGIEDCYTSWLAVAHEEQWLGRMGDRRHRPLAGHPRRALIVPVQIAPILQGKERDAATPVAHDREGPAPRPREDVHWVT